jgi:hypothetical protein
MIGFIFLDEAGVGKKRHPKPVGYGDIPIPVGMSIGLSKLLASKSVAVLVKYEGGPFRERHDGGGPVSNANILSASGYLRGDGDEYFYSRDEAPLLNVILDSAGPVTITSGILRVTYYG